MQIDRIDHVLGDPLPNRTCPLCGGANQCAPAVSGSFDTPCWCKAVTIDAAALAGLTGDQRRWSCLCRRCAADPARSAQL